MRAPASAPHAPPAPSSALPSNVRALGWVAFFNDTATEMSYWLLPQFLVGVLGAGPMVFGFIEGAAESVASLGRLASGFLSDRLRRRKPLAAIGYTLANLAKPLLALSQTWPQVFWIRFADRAAKGFRAAPRDALIADSVPAATRGAAFGFRQAMDSAGAVVGPLAAVALLPMFLGDVRKIFWAAALPGSASILLAWFAVREVRPATTGSAAGAKRGIAQAFREKNWRLLVVLVAVAVFSLGNSSDLFLVLRAQNLGVAAALAPALGLVFNIVFTALSWPAGKLSDRVPRRALIVAGYLVYAGVYFGFARINSSFLVWPLFAIYGLYYALTEGVLRAWIADLVPSESRASVFGIFNWVVGVMAFPASLLAGWLWDRYSPATPFFLSGALAVIAALLLLFAGKQR
ncbi:MAG: MFS transporter [Acidobacteria bacterium]|nr:MFS transporter [Acidobacteriota bacterium]